MKLYIPRLGDEIVLTKDWTFDLYCEDRNDTMITKFNVDFGQVAGQSWYHLHDKSVKCTVPAGSILKIDRIFIRKGAQEYDSITFFWKGGSIPAWVETINYERSEEVPVGTPNSVVTHGYGQYNPTRAYIRVPAVRYDKHPKRPVRFWAKMDDANTIEFEKLT